MEFIQELVFTISFSLIVSLLIAKLFSIASSSDDGYSRKSIRVEEKIGKEWVVCDSEKEGKDRVFVEDLVMGSEEVDFGCVGGIGDELGSGVVVEDTGSESGVGACYVFDEMPERIEWPECNDGGGGLVGGDEGDVVECSGSLVEEDCVKSGGVGEVKFEEEDESLDDGDWLGIEATELEKRFGTAVAFVDSKVGSGGVHLIDNDVKVQLYGLHKVAIEGSCFEPQPMALKVSARANWNSWKRVENLGREDAMEQYIALLSQHVPGWMGSHSPDKQ